MPIDLSDVGIAGQLAGNQILESQARIRAADVTAREKAFELDKLSREQALADKASSLLGQLARGNAKTLDDPKAAADRMTSSAQPLEVLSQLYMRGGAPEKGMEFLKAASTIRKQESDIENDAITAKKNRLEIITKGAEAVSQWLGVAKNQSEWDYGVKQLRAQGIIEPEFLDQMAAMEYNPDVVEYFNEQAISAAERARLEMQANTANRQERESAIRIAQGAQRLEMQRARNQEAARHNKAMEKISGSKGTSVSSPSDSDLKSAKKALKTTVFRDVDTEDDSDFEAAADYVASQAKALVQSNKNLTWDTAVQRVIIQGQQEGAFGIDPAKTTLFGLYETEPAKAKFDSAGLNADAPLAMPKDKSQMKKGRYYETARGKAMWNGKAFVPVD